MKFPPRQNFVRRAAIVTACIVGAFNSIAAAQTVSIVSPARTISPDTNHYQGWPTLTQLKNGKLIVTYSGGREDHLCPFGRIEAITSTDDGETWTWPRVLFDSDLDDRDAAILETRSGTLLMPILNSTVYQLDLNNHDRRFKDMPRPERDAMFARWQLAHDRTTDEQKKTLLGENQGRWMLRSTDGGHTWQTPYEIPAYNLSGAIETRDGRLLFAGTDPKKPAVWESKDDGLTWEVLSVLPTRAGEMDMVEATDGRLIVHVRGHIRDGKREQGTFQTVSRDGGKTWSDPVCITKIGWPAQPIRLRDGTLLTIYSVRSKPFGIRGMRSTDNGDTWSDEFTVYGDGAGWDLGYPTTTELKDGSLLTVWYEKMPDNPNAILRQSRWRLESQPAAAAVQK